MEHVAQVRVVDAACDVAHPPRGLGGRARSHRRRRRARREHPAPGLVLADELHHDVRRIGVVDVEHADDVIADHLARRARLGEDLVDDRRALAAEHLDRDIAAELAIVGLPDRCGRADVEQHAELVALAAQPRRGLVVADPLAVRAQPNQGLRREPANRPRIGARRARASSPRAGSRIAPSTSLISDGVMPDRRAPARWSGARRGSSCLRRSAC